MTYHCNAVLRKGPRIGEECGHEWVLRHDRPPKKCPMCQSFSGFGPIQAATNPGARELIGTASTEEVRLMAGVLSLLRSGDRIWADGVRQAVARHEAETKPVRRRKTGTQ